MTEMRAAGLRKWVVLLFLASGFSGLVYQVVWVRLLTPVFGVSAYAISTVLASFMGGLALGSYAFGRFIDRRTDPLRIYALLETGIGVYAVLVPPLFGLTTVVVRLAYHVTGESAPFVFGLLRAVIAFLILVTPTTLMGATLPVLCKFFVESLDRVGRETGKLYFINTLGAVIGCAGAGFFLIPTFGLYAAIGVAAVVNLGVGATAYLLHRRAIAGGIEGGGPVVAAAVPEPVAPRPLSPASRWIVAAFALSGLTALVLEVVWSRVLILIFGSTVYSFAAMLSVFLLGIALGGALFGKLADRIGSPYRLLGLMQAAIALIVLAEAATINHLPALFLRLLAAAGVTDSSLILIKFVISFGILFPLTLVSGGTFPVVSKVFTDSLERTGREIGIVYSMNTLGAIVGSILGGFVIVPYLGMRHGLIFAAGLSLATGAVTLLFPVPVTRRRPALAGVLTLAGVAGAVLLPAWNAALLSVPVWFQPLQYIGKNGRVDLNDVIMETKNLFYKEGVNDTIIVNESPTERSLSINGKIIATTNWEDVLHLKMLGLLPVLLHPGHPKTALNIGLGVGGTVSGLASYDLDAVYGAELEPRVVQANHFFSSVNDDILKNPRFHIVVADGRNLLSLSPRTYDIISSDPFEPFMTGAGDLYSKQFFELGRRRLNPGGLMTQWVPLHQTAGREFRSLLKTFASVFPHTTVWFSGRSVILIGSESKLALDPELLRKRMAEPRAAPALTKLGVDTPERLMSFLVADETTLAPYLADAPINTDSFPFVEYSSAWAILKQTAGSNLAAMSRHFLSPDAVLGYVKGGHDDPPGFDPARALSLVDAKREGIEGIVDSLEGRPQQAYQKLTESVARSHDPFMTLWLATYHERAGLAAQRAGDVASAMAHFQAAIDLVPDRFVSLGNLGYLKFLAGDVATARTLLERAHGLYPSSADVDMRLAAVLDATGDHAGAQDLYEKAAAARPDLGLPLSLLALHHLTTGDPKTAETLFRKSLARSGGDDPPTQEYLAQAVLAQGKAAEAEKLCRDLVRDHPERTTCRVLLARMRIQKGDLAGAKTELLGAAQIDPKDPDTFFQLARVEMALGEQPAAVQALRKAIALGGKDVAARAGADVALAPIVAEASR